MQKITGSPRVGQKYLVRFGKGFSRTLVGTLDHVRRVRSGAVLGWLRDENGRILKPAIPVTTYAVWYKLKEDELTTSPRTSEEGMRLVLNSILK